MSGFEREPTRDASTLAALEARPRAARRAGKSLRHARACIWGRRAALVYITDDGYVHLVNDGLSSAATYAHAARASAQSSGSELRLTLFGKAHAVAMTDPAEAADVVRMIEDAQARWAAKKEAALPKPPIALTSSGRLVGSCVYLAGHETGLQPNEPYDLLFDHGRLDVACSPMHSESRPSFSREYGDIAEVAVEGPGRYKTGGGFIGGGFGMSGALEGMAVAAILNSLTTRTRVQTVISLRGPGWEGFFLHTVMTPDELRRHLSPVFVALSQRAEPAAPAAVPPADPPTTSSAAGTDVLQALERLASLHAEGALSAEEFQQAKARVLGLI